MKYFFLLLILINSTVFAEPTGESASNRKKINHSLILQLTGSIQSISPVTGLYYDHYLDSNSIVQIGVQQTLQRELRDLETGEQIKYRNINVHYKRFLENAFYIRGGLDYRRVDYKYVSYFANGTLEENTQFEGKGWFASFALGHQWQWDNFTLGADWFGMAAPITKSYDSKYSDGTFSVNLRRMSDETEYLLGQTQYFFVFFYLGYSF